MKTPKRKDQDFQSARGMWEKIEINKARMDMGLKPLKERQRFCLRCDKAFLSAQDSVRICDNCKGFKEQVEECF